jgi:hypothetical protein
MYKRIALLILIIFVAQFVDAQKPLNIFGGRNHDVFLGCLNCNAYGSTSIWNAYSAYGSKFNSNSIWNAYGAYGNSYSENSPFNPYSVYPPVIVDNDGSFYGYFTVNENHDKRANFSLVLTIYRYYDMIRDDVSKWYEKIFN